MNKSNILTIAVLVLLPATIVASNYAFAHQKAKAPVCQPAVLAAFKPLPKLKYRCDAELSDYDEKVLKQPNRIKAIKVLERSLGSFTNSAWWQANVDDLNLCELRRKPGALSPEEQEKIRNQDYTYDLFGSHSVRLALLRDPCYITEFFGSNAFLLHRKAGKVFVTQVLDGFSSRADNPVGLNFADLNGQQIIEITTGTGGLHPSITYYYFVIDPKTNKAVPKKLFGSNKGLTNEVSSDLLMSDPEDFGLPKDATELNIIRGHKLAPSFSFYSEDSEGKIEAENSGKFTRTILKWNGRFYQ
jgi:hypothetical protein